MRAVPLLLLLAGCGGADAASGNEVPVDSSLVDALVDLHLADARTTLTPDSLQSPAWADSLRTVALSAHGLDEAHLRDHLDALADDPARARATYDAVEAELSDARQGPLF